MDGGILARTLFAWDGDRLIEQSKVGDQSDDNPDVTTWEYLPGGWRPVAQIVGSSAVDAEFFAIISDLVGTRPNW